MSRTRPRVVIVGGGITGLVAARNLQRDHEVIVVEAADRLGGKISTVIFRNHPLDTGADAFITRNPAALNLCESLGLGDHLVEPSSSSAAIYSRRRVRPLPEGLVFGIPTDLVKLIQSRTVGIWGSVRMIPDLAARRPALADNTAAAADGLHNDPTVAEVLVPRFGRRIVARLIDPLIGGINAGDVDQLSIAATLPQITERLRLTKSVARGLASNPRPPESPGHSIFRGLSNGMSQLIDAIEADLLSGGTTIYRDEQVRAITKSTDHGYLVAGTHRQLEADHILLATPAHVSAQIVAPLDPELARTLDEIPYASVATVTFAWPTGDTDPSVGRQLAALVGQRSPYATASTTERLLPGSGVLIARDESLMITAASFTSTKWPRSANPGEVVIRISLGRHGDERPNSLTDDELVRVIRYEIARTLTIAAAPLEFHLQRWPASFPQYVRGHGARVRAIEQLSQSLGIELAGAAYHGIGIPSCIDSATAAAERIRSASQLAL